MILLSNSNHLIIMLNQLLQKSDELLSVSLGLFFLPEQINPLILLLHRRICTFIRTCGYMIDAFVDNHLYL